MSDLPRTDLQDLVDDDEASYTMLGAMLAFAVFLVGFLAGWAWGSWGID